MVYDIIFLREERVLSSIPWDKGLQSAKTHAKDYIAIRQADRVEVRDESGTLVFHHPRTLRRA